MSKSCSCARLDAPPRSNLSSLANGDRAPCQGTSKNDLKTIWNCMGNSLAAAGYVTSLFSAYLGGELVFAKGIAVNHVAWEGGSDEYVAVMNEQDLAVGKLTRVDAAGIPAVLLKEGKTIYAIGATCTHLAGPLDEGTVENGIVQCPWHGSRFCMKDGSVVNGPAVYAQPTFAVRVRDGKIELRRLEHA